jgi:Zn finger protein HypA/HybF involved in hydrogenase expression
MPYIKTPEGEKYVDDFINTIKVGDKIYALQASIVEVKEIKCKNCGHPLKLEYGEGTCEMCGSHYSTHFEIVQC